MVTTGFSRIHVATYSNTGSTVTYTGVQELARAKKMESDITTKDDNNFYANNGLAETEPAKMKEGKLKLTVDGLSAEEEALILGITESQVGEVAAIEFGDDMEPPYLGVGAVKRMQLHNVVSYRPVIFKKVRFSIPPDAAETEEDGINWQIQELEAKIMRDDSAKHTWKVIPKENFTTEDEAVAYIRKVLGGEAAAAASTLNGGTEA